MTAETATSAYVIVIRDHVSSPNWGEGMIREVIGPFFTMADAEAEVSYMLDGTQVRMHNATSSDYYNTTQGLTRDNKYSLSIHESVLPVKSRWNGHEVPWTGLEQPPYFDLPTEPA